MSDDHPIYNIPSDTPLLIEEDDYECIINDNTDDNDDDYDYDYAIQNTDGRVAGVINTGIDTVDLLAVVKTGNDDNDVDAKGKRERRRRRLSILIVAVMIIIVVDVIAMRNWDSIFNY